MLCIINRSILPIDRTLSGATYPGQSGPIRDDNVGIFPIPKSFCITGVPPSNCLMSYPGHSLGESYLSVEIQSVYSTTPATRAEMVSQHIQDTRWGVVLTYRQRCSRCILPPHSPFLPFFHFRGNNKTLETRPVNEHVLAKYCKTFDSHEFHKFSIMIYKGCRIRKHQNII